MQAAVVHDGGVGQDPPCKQKRLAFKFASAAWVDANRDVGGGAESKWKEMHPSEQRAMPGADTRAGAAAAAWRASHAPVSARVVVLVSLLGGTCESTSGSAAAQWSVRSSPGIILVVL